MPALQLNDQIPDFNNVEDFKLWLTMKGCQRCDLGFQKDINGVCISRGSAGPRMLIGESPGLVENNTRKSFTGPAGRLMDRIWASVGMSIDDWYLTNTILCRPIAPDGSGKQNLTPKMEQKRRCRPFLDLQIGLIKPRIIVTVGAIATAAILGKSSIRMGDYRGKLITDRAIMIADKSDSGTMEIGRPFIFPILHPAALLHAQRDPTKHQQYKQWMWDDIRKLKQILIEEKIDV